MKNTVTIHNYYTYASVGYEFQTGPHYYLHTRSYLQIQKKKKKVTNEWTDNKPILAPTFIGRKLNIVHRLFNLQNNHDYHPIEKFQCILLVGSGKSQLSAALCQKRKKNKSYHLSLDCQLVYL